MRLAVTWRAAGNCLHLFASGTIEPRSIFPKRVIDGQSICWDYFHSSGIREGDNGFVPVSKSTRSSALRRFDGASTTGATVGRDNPLLTAAVLNFFAACADVVTKPKLDKHRAMCRASFDCIDCNKHFETPTDYKGHTTCISEAEKYQKTLYNGGVSEPAIQKVSVTNRERRVVPKGMVETKDGGSRVVEGNGGITDSKGNNET
jgi:hypothetical protein